MITGSTKPRRSPRPLMTDAPCLDASQLRKAGVLRPGARTRGTLEFFATPTESPILIVHYVTDLSISDAFIELQHEASSGPYRLEVRRLSTPAGDRFWLVCPIALTVARKLYCAIIDGRPADRFGSAAAYSLCFPSDRLPASHRALFHSHRVQQIIGAKTAAHLPEARRGGRGLGKKTIARQRAEIAAADSKVWGQVMREMRTHQAQTWELAMREYYEGKER